MLSESSGSLPVSSCLFLSSQVEMAALTDPMDPGVRLVGDTAPAQHRGGRLSRASGSLAGPALRSGRWGPHCCDWHRHSSPCSVNPRWVSLPVLGQGSRVPELCVSGRVRGWFPSTGFHSVCMPGCVQLGSRPRGAPDPGTVVSCCGSSHQLRSPSSTPRRASAAPAPFWATDWGPFGSLSPGLTLFLRHHPLSSPVLIAPGQGEYLR